MRLAFDQLATDVDDRLLTGRRCCRQTRLPAPTQRPPIPTRHSKLIECGAGGEQVFLERSVFTSVGPITWRKRQFGSDFVLLAKDALEVQSEFRGT